MLKDYWIDFLSMPGVDSGIVKTNIPHPVINRIDGNPVIQCLPQSKANGPRINFSAQLTQ